ncbi:MAG: VOC family protein [Lysobacterales bacterium]|jgi:catechol 2,3-dioxygenase-like lactoylglutathione lyase family enzyme
MSNSPALKLDHIVLFLSDLERCVPFYDRLLPLLGFKKLREHVFVNAEANYFDLRQAVEPEYGYHRNAPGLNHLAFAATKRAQIVEIGEAMAASGFDVPAIQEFSDGSALFLRDADGMRIEIGVTE